MERFFSKILEAGAAAVIAVLSGLGIGSGGLLVIWLTMVEGIDAESARGLNLLFFVFSAGAALIIHLLKGRLRLLLVLFLSSLACIGTLAGAYLGTIIDPVWLKRIFGAMLTASGICTFIGTMPILFKKKEDKTETKKI